MRCWGELKRFRTQSVGEVSAVLSNSHFTVIPIFKQIETGLMRWALFSCHKTDISGLSRSEMGQKGLLF